MPHPRRIVASKVPRFSELVGSTAPALQSPLKHENTALEPPKPIEKQPFNPRAAAYTLAFVSVLIGGLYTGFQYRESTDRRKRYEALSIDGKIEDLKQYKEKLLEQRQRMEDRVIKIIMQTEQDSGNTRR